ncbi:MAG: bis(5'-nucleosyl)-tetraphosphatase (symmetrical) YqeK [Acholeplasmataceae bacterium]|jgi:predicted HD superfamily hydrolase involved in NAD metabolism
MKELEKIVSKKFSDHPNRMIHTKGVIQVAIELGKLYNVDEMDCYLAALFHDYTKYDTVDMHRNLLGNDIISEFKDYPFIYHAYSAAAALKEIRPETTNYVLDAIKYHIWCRPNATKLDKIIYLADKCEPNRTYSYSKEVYRLALNDLDEALVYALKSNIKHLESKGVIPHPDQIKTLVFYQIKKEET